MTSTSTELPADPRVVKKMEKDIANEAKADERDYQCALKELKRTEKSEAKASKVCQFGSSHVPLTLAQAARKAERHLKKMEDKEHDVIKTLQEATHTHDKAVTDVHTAESGVQVSLEHLVFPRAGDLHLA